MNLRPVHEANKGFGDGLAQAFEVVVTPAIFGALGYAADRSLGTTPLLTILLPFIVAGYVVWKMVRTYDADMAAHDADAPWTQPARPRPADDLAEATHG